MRQKRSQNILFFDDYPTPWFFIIWSITCDNTWNTVKHLPSHPQFGTLWVKTDVICSCGKPVSARWFHRCSSPASQATKAHNTSCRPGEPGLKPMLCWMLWWIHSAATSLKTGCLVAIATTPLDMELTAREIACPNIPFRCLWHKRSPKRDELTT